jgi:hypothetical protein
LSSTDGREEETRRAPKSGNHRNQGPRGICATAEAKAETDASKKPRYASDKNQAERQRNGDENTERRWMSVSDDDKDPAKPGPVKAEPLPPPPPREPGQGSDYSEDGDDTQTFEERRS